MQQPDFHRLVDTAIATLGGSPTSKEVEAAVVRLLEDERKSHAPSPAFIDGLRASVSLASCSSRRSTTQRARVYDRVKTITSKLVEANYKTNTSVGGASLPTVQIDVRDTETLWAGHDPTEFISVFLAVEQAILDAGGHPGLGPFVDLSMAQNFGFLDVIPEVLRGSKSLIPVLQIGTEQNPIDPDVIESCAMACSIQTHHESSSPVSVAIGVNMDRMLSFDRFVHERVTAISSRYTRPDDFLSAKEYGLLVASSCTDCFQWVRCEMDLTDSLLTLDNAPPSSNSENVLHHSYFPFYGKRSNKVIYPLKTPYLDIQELILSRLEAFAHAGKRAGLLIQC